MAEYPVAFQFTTRSHRGDKLKCVLKDKISTLQATMADACIGTERAVDYI